MRVIEFLTEAYKAFYRPELHKLFIETNLYNSLLFFFDHYPFHNILHMKVCDIFMTLLNKASSDDSVITSVLDETHLLRKILDTAKEGALYTLKSTGLTLSRGYMPFIRKLANKLADIAKNSSEVANFLDSIPEWGEYFENDLKKHNEIEARPLGQDPRAKKNQSPSDDLLDLMFKIKRGGSGAGSNKVEDNKDDDDENEDDDEEESSDNIFSNTATEPLNSKGFQNDDDEDEDDSQAIFDKIMLKNSGGDDDEDEDDAHNIDSGIETNNYSSERGVAQQASNTPHFNSDDVMQLSDIVT